MLTLPCLPADTLGRIMPRADGLYRLIAVYPLTVPGFGTHSHGMWVRIGA